MSCGEREGFIASTDLTVPRSFPSRRRGDVLHLFRRHYPPCPCTSRRYRRCQCPTWVQGSLGGERLKKSLNLTSWEAASDLVTAWTASGEIGVVKTEAPSVGEAVLEFLNDARARRLGWAWMRKYENLLERRFLKWCEANGYSRVQPLDVDALRR